MILIPFSRSKCPHCKKWHFTAEEATRHRETLAVGGGTETPSIVRESHQLIKQ
jgi:hypothetical protein